MTNIDKSCNTCIYCEFKETYNKNQYGNCNKNNILLLCLQKNCKYYITKK